MMRETWRIKGLLSVTADRQSYEYDALIKE